MPANKYGFFLFNGMNKAQAELLADGLLDELGSGKDGMEPRETIGELLLLAAELAEDAVDNLIKSKNNASGDLQESIQVEEPEVNGNIISCNVYMNFYGKFQDKGVKGTRSGFGLYSFKTEFPSEKMVSAIKEWIKRAKQSTRTVKKYEGYGSHEIKNRTISELSSAYGKARAIKMYGIKATGFMSKAILKTEAKVSDRLGAAFQVDILNSLELGENLSFK